MHKSPQGKGRGQTRPKRIRLLPSASRAATRKTRLKTSIMIPPVWTIIAEAGRKR